jgi:hypothetical protein
VAAKEPYLVERIVMQANSDPRGACTAASRRSVFVNGAKRLAAKVAM